MNFQYFLQISHPERNLKATESVCRFYILVVSTDSPGSLEFCVLPDSGLLVFLSLCPHFMFLSKYLFSTLPAKMSLMLFPFNTFLLGEPFKLIIPTPSRG